MIRLGMVDFDTSHVVEFTRRLNHVDIEEEQWVEGARVVVGCAGTSEAAPERIAGYEKQMREYGVPLVESPEEMIGQIDGVMITSIAGNPHLERVRPFLEAGVPAFVDKPFACNVADAREMVRLARVHERAILSASSLRYAPEVVEATAEDAQTGPLVGAFTYGPAHLHPGNPGLFHYGIHPVEMLYTLMGPGCRRVTCVKDAQQGEVVTGYWEGGRVASVRGLRGGHLSYGFTAFGERSVVSREVGTQYIYRELLKRVVRMFETGEAPVAPEVTVEIIAFIAAALESAVNGSRPVEVARG